MFKFARLFVYAGFVIAIPATDTLGKVPVISLAVVAVDSIAVPGGSARHVRVLPGDILTLKVYVRNWSPAGEVLNAYQMQLESLDFTSGSAGAIKPVDYDETRETSAMNLKNCFVDQNDPEWAFSGRQNITLVDTRSAGYRWMSVLVDSNDAIPCKQDDKKYYTGTISMRVSDDALGTFTIGFMEVSTASLLLDEHGVLITPTEFEALTIVVRPDILAIIDRLNGVEDISVERGDTNGDGKVAISDARKALDLLNGLDGE